MCVYLLNGTNLLQDEEKRISAVMVRKEEDRRRELQKISIMKVVYTDYPTTRSKYYFNAGGGCDK